MFKIENLPADVYNKVYDVIFFDDDERESTGNMGLVWLEEGLEFTWDGTCSAFTSRKDLINIVRNETYQHHQVGCATCINRDKCKELSDAGIELNDGSDETGCEDYEYDENSSKIEDVDTKECW